MKLPGRGGLTPGIVARGAAALTVGGSLTALMEWLFDNHWFESLLPGAATMKANSALGLMLLAAALWLLSSPDIGVRRRRIAQVMSGAAVVIGLATLFEYGGAADLHIDQLLFHDGLQATALTRPGRMAPGTAAALVLLGAALLYRDSSRRIGGLDEVLSLCAAGIGLVGLLGYLYRVPVLYQGTYQATIAIQTAALILVLALGVTAAAPRGRLATLITSRGLGGLTFRRLLPSALLVPSLLGALLLSGQRAGLYNSEFTVAILVAGTLTFFASILWKTSERIERLDGDRRALIAGLERRVHERTSDLALRAEQLEQSNAELEQFAYVASHDLQEPLRMVTSYVQLLARRYRGGFDAEADEYIEFAVEGAARMQTLIRDLLAYSRVGTMDAAPSTVSAESCVALAVHDLASTINESGAVVTSHDLPEVLATAPELVQVFENLIGNALKFRRSASPVIDIRAERRGDLWEVSVADNGIGLDPQYRERIFMVFQRLHRREEFPGTGIGLAICKKVVERNGGRIWVDATPGGGSTFRFTLPIATPEGAHAQTSGIVVTETRLTSRPPGVPAR